jgi:septal ring factor EnvC (AmiA/AmiB activator)
LINVRDKILREKEIEHLNDTLSNLKHELKETKERSSHEISSLRSSFTQEKNALAKRLEESNLTISQNNVKIMSLEQSLDSEIKNCERVKRELEKYLTEKQADYVAVKG